MYYYLNHVKNVTSDKNWSLVFLFPYISSTSPGMMTVLRQQSAYLHSILKTMQTCQMHFWGFYIPVHKILTFIYCRYNSTINRASPMFLSLFQIPANSNLIQYHITSHTIVKLCSCINYVALLHTSIYFSST
jgi:hypothetical protein